MNEPSDLPTAQALLRQGDFFSAMQAFGNLLEVNPEDLELSAAYFIAHYWFNRQDSQKLRKPGRELASFLIEEWEAFEQVAYHKGLAQSSAFLLAQEAVLGKAAEQFRRTFQEEGASVVSSQSLDQLARCLLRLGDNQNAAEILLYARNHHPRNAHFLFLLGEALARLSEPKERLRGLAFFRDACLLDHRSLPLEIVSSSPAREVITDLNERSQNDREFTIEWFPAFFLAAIFQERLREFTSQERDFLETERHRLQTSLHKSPARFHERIRAMLSFILLLLMKEARCYGDGASHELTWQAELGEIEPELLARIRNL